MSSSHINYPRVLNLPPTDGATLAKFMRLPLDFQATDRQLHLNQNLSFANEMTPARDQNPLGTCASFGIISCLEFFHKKDLSEACLTHEIETSIGDCQDGLTLGEAIDHARRKGTVEEQYWPYDHINICFNPAPNVSQYPRYKFNDVWLLYHQDIAGVLRTMKDVSGGMSYESTDNFIQDPVNLIKAALVQYHIPVAIGVPVFFRNTQLDANWESGPDIHMPRPIELINFLSFSANSNRSGGAGWHTLPICGFNDDAQRFEFKNSWGTYWGTNGFGTIPYDYVRTYCREAFAATG